MLIDVSNLMDSNADDKVDWVLKTRLGGLHAILGFDNWPALLLGRLFDRKTGFVGYRKGDLEFLVDHRGGDQNGTRMCIASDMYRRYIPFFKLPKPVKILDLGASGGGFPLMLRVEGIPVDRAVCVEMNPLTCMRLGLNLATNLGFSAVAINAAVCAMPEGSEVYLEQSRGDTGRGLFNSQVDSSMPAVSVRTTTFQTLYDKYFKDGLVDICKIDIEGAEYEALESTADQVLTKIRYLLIEFHDPSKTPRPIERFKALGFVEMTDRNNSKTSGHTEVRAFRGPQA